MTENEEPADGNREEDAENVTPIYLRKSSIREGVAAPHFPIQKIGETITMSGGTETSRMMTIGTGKHLSRWKLIINYQRLEMDH